MMKVDNVWLWGLSVCLAAWFGCRQPGTVQQPSVPDEKLARVMADLSVAEAATNGLNGYPRDSLMHAYFKQVFEMHGITAERYEQDLRIVASELGRMEEIVKKAEEMLQEGGGSKQEK